MLLIEGLSFYEGCVILIILICLVLSERHAENPRKSSDSSHFLLQESHLKMQCFNKYFCQTSKKQGCDYKMCLSGVAWGWSFILIILICLVLSESSFSQNTPSSQCLLTKEDKVLKIGEKFENESERIFIATKIVRQKDSNRICSQLNRF